MSRFYIGCDLGQSHDPTAIAVVQRVGDHFRCGHLERVPLGTPYPAIIGRVAHLMNHPAVAGNCELAIDATGVGRAVADMFTHAGIRFIGCIITAGHEETVGGKDNYRHVPKIQLISHVQALLHAGQLRIRKDLPEAANLVRELQDFKVNYSATGFMSFSAREGAHDDLVLALAIAIWCAKRAKTGQESWAEYLERGDWGAATDRDDIQPLPDFGPNFSTDPLVDVVVPPIVVAEGKVGNYSIRRVGHQAVVAMTRAGAADWLRNPVWRQLNPELAKKLLGETA